MRVGGAGVGAVAAYGARRLYGKRSRSYAAAGPSKRRRAARSQHKRSRSFRGAPGSLKPRVKKLEKFMANQTSTKTCRTFHSQQLLAAVNAQNMDSYDSPTVTTIASCISDVRMFNKSAPATLLTVDLDVGTYSQQILVKWHHSCQIVNNYQSRCEVWLYSCFVKADTTITAADAITNGLADNPSGAITAATYGALPTDSSQFKDLYSCKLLKHKLLSPGQGCSGSASAPYFEYDPATLDSHTSGFQRKLYGHTFVVVVRGSGAHDTAVAGEVGAIACGIDVIRKKVTTLKYDAGGVDLNDLDINIASFDTPTNGFVQSSKPVSDNIGYSVA